MAKCKECGKSIRAWMALGGVCEDCYSSQEESQANLKRKHDAARLDPLAFQLFNDKAPHVLIANPAD